ncbi:MAG: HGGxSTG domain-containing protein [Microvirga sp.]
MDSNPMHPRIRRGNQPSPLLAAPRCGAQTRAGLPCQSPAVRGRKRCRMHGGAKGSGAPGGECNGAYRHGLRTNEMMAFERAVRELIRISRRTIDTQIG